MDKKQKEQMMRFPVILEPPKPEDAVYEIQFGAIGGATPFDWNNLAIQYEKQGGTSGCVSWSRLNAGELRAKRDGMDINFSDRHLFVISGTSKTGNGLVKVADKFRDPGVVKEENFPWPAEYISNPDKYWTQIFDTSSIPADAQRFKGGNYQWINPDNRAVMGDALSYTPIQIAIGVGDNWGAGIIKDPGTYFTYHAVVQLGYTPEGHRVIMDSYEPFIKTLDKNYKVMQALAFRDLPENWKEVHNQYFEIIRKVFGPTWTPAPIFYKRGLVARGIYGACRVGGSSSIPPYRVFTLGPGGGPVNSPDEFYKLFGTLTQTGIVGAVNPEQARLLGITGDVLQSASPIFLKDSWWLALWQKINF